MPQEIEVMLQLTEKRKEVQDNASAVIDDELPAELKERVQALLGDLARKDFSMALLDLAQLSRTVTGSLEVAASGSRPSTSFGPAAIIRTLIYGEDGTTVAEQCDGPTKSAACPRVSLGYPVACAGRWILAGGWRFRVASEAAFCPVAELGIVGPQPAARAVGSAACSLTTNPCDLFVTGSREAPKEWAGDVVEEGYRLTA